MPFFGYYYFGYFLYWLVVLDGKKKKERILVEKERIHFRRMACVHYDGKNETMTFFFFSL